MAGRYQTKIIKARFVHSPFTASQMAAFGQSLLDDIWDRISQAQNVYDAPALPLRPGYARFKKRRYGTDLRNLQATGQTRRATKVLTASQNEAVLGPLPGVHGVGKRKGILLTYGQILMVNNRRERQWGVSPKNRDKIVSEIMAGRPMRAQQISAA